MLRSVSEAFPPNASLTRASLHLPARIFFLFGTDFPLLDIYFRDCDVTAKRDRSVRAIN